MKIFSAIIIFLTSLFYVHIFDVYSQTVAPNPKDAQIKSLDMDKDGDAEVVYHSDGKYVSKVEADTNNDGKPDLTVNYKGGKFQSAEVDTNYDGKVDKKFNNNVEFNKWVNDTHPRYADEVQKDNVEFVNLKF